MGRHRGFDEGQVLTRAMEAFRRRGYAAVSIKDLEDETGLKGGSIYNSFGDKAGLFDAAFAHYNRNVLQDRLDTHAPESAGIHGVRKLFDSLLEEPNGGSFGCLITNTAVEFGGGKAVPKPVGEAFHLLTATFTDRLYAARRSGAIRRDVKPEIAAAKLLALYQGILVLFRAGWDRTALKALIKSEFDDLGVRRK